MYAEVFVDVPNRRLDQSYHYLVPEDLTLKPGMRVLVPLQHRQVQGLVVSLTETLPADLGLKGLRPILKIIEGENILPPELIELAQWLAETTICSLAQSLHTVWPLLKGKVEEWVMPMAAADDPDLQVVKWLDSEVFQAVSVLHRSRRKALPVATFLTRARISPQTLEQIVSQGWVKKEFRFSNNGTVPVAAKVRRSDESSGESIPLTVTDESPEYFANAYDLTLEQSSVVAEVFAALNERTYQTYLLHGVTGSGKTEVYRQLITKVLAAGGGAILLVPEIALTSQVSQYLQRQFNSEMIVLHSGVTPAAKVQAWTEILTGKKRLVIGARSAVFAPVLDLRLIIIDEEHDGAYKQDENPKYHARDVARKRMEQAGGLVLLGSATPSLEAYAAAKNRKIRLLTMAKRVGHSFLPPVHIIDMREELLKGNRSIFSLALQSSLRERINNGEQTMLLLNRRGYSTFVICRECGFTVRCPSCDVALTYHSHGQVMRCHYCNHEEVPPHHCPQCGSRYIRFFGQGTQRVEEELQGLFPDVPVFRLDFDTTRSLEAHRTILDRFRREETAVLVGTQMIAKGLDFPNVTLVGVIAADQTLNMPDFRARERTFQLLTQVAGRAGRRSKKGEVVVQTYSPADRAIISAAAHDFPGFFWEEIKYRRERQYPPFTHVIRVLVMHEKEERVIKAAQDLMGSLQEGIKNFDFGNNGLDVPELLGPAPAVLSKLKNLYRWQVAVKGKRTGFLRAFLHQGVQGFYQRPSSSGITLNVEVDPL